MSTPSRTFSDGISRCSNSELKSHNRDFRDTSRSTARTSPTSPSRAKSVQEAFESVSSPHLSSNVPLPQHPQPQPQGVALTASAPHVAVAPAMLANPLSMQATVLRTPDFFVNPLPAGDDLVEEGDILYDTLKDMRFESDEPDDTADVGEEAEGVNVGRMRALACASPIPVIGVQPVLTLPDKVGKYLAHEHLKALICFINGAVYPLFNLRFRIEVLLPKEAARSARAPVRRSLIHETCAEMHAKSSHAHAVDVPLDTAGTYVLEVHVLYLDPSGEERRLNWASSFVVEQALAEVSRRGLRRVRLAPGPGLGSPTQDEALRNLRLPLHRYLLSVGLQNTCSVPLMLCRAQFVAASSSSSADGGGEGAESPMRIIRPANTVGVGERGGAGSRAASAVFLQPGEKYQCVFEFLILTDALRNLLFVCNASTGLSSPLLKPPLNGPLGFIEWEWRRWNGDGGIERSNPVLLEELVGLPVMELVVVRVRSASSGSGGVRCDGEKATSSSAIAAPESEEASADMRDAEHLEQTGEESLQAGQPAEFELCIVRYGKHAHSDDEAPLDVALKVRPEKLAPHWLYTGAIPRRLGYLELNSTLSFKLTLLPWGSGWLLLPRDSLEIVDARSPERVLAPLPPVLIKSTSIAVPSSFRRESERPGSILTGSLVGPNAQGLAQKKVLTTVSAVEGSVDHKANGNVAGLRVEEDQSDSILCKVLVL